MREEADRTGSEMGWICAATALAEADALTRILNLAEDLGHNVPTEHNPNCRMELPFTRDGWYSFSENGLDPIGRAQFDALAIAQHHGVPTRLLDWSFSPLRASFFATSDSIQLADRLAVWAFNANYMFGLNYGALRVGYGSLVDHIEPRKFQNAYLRQQQGTFTATTVRPGPDMLTAWPALETVVPMRLVKLELSP